MTYRQSLLALLALFFTTGTQAAITDNTYRNNEEYYFHAGLGVANTGYYYINDGDAGSRTLPLSGLAGLGGDFEYMVDYDFGMVATVRYYTLSEEVEDANEDFKLSAFSLGASARFHYLMKFWNFYFSPGLSFTTASTEYGENESEAALTVAPTLALGVMVAITEAVSLGVENYRVIGMGAALNGTIIDDFMIKARFGL